MRSLRFLPFCYLCLVVLWWVVGLDRVSAQGAAALPPEEKKACEELKGYLNKYKAAIVHSRDAERDRRIADLKKQYSGTLDKLPGAAKAELATWERRCTLVYDTVTGEMEKREEDLAVSFGILFQACRGALKP